MYYITILEQTGSRELKSFYHNNNTNSGIIGFSKCAILKVLNLIDWGMDASKARDFKQNKVIFQCNYWDYINA